jgi:VWFA-related protein
MHSTSRPLVRPSVVAALLVAAGVSMLALTVQARQGRPQAAPRSAPSASPRPDRQMPAVTFRVEVNYVEIDVAVQDQAGHFVPDLEADDFRVYENRKLQKVANFGVVELPVERPDAPLFVRRPIEPDVQSNVREFDGRVYLIVLDQLHISPLHTSWVRAAAKKFIQNAMGANDLAAVVSTQGRASQDFTGNKRLLMAAVDKFIGAALTSATLNKIDDYRSQQRIGRSTSGNTMATTQTDNPYKDFDDMQRQWNASSTLGAIESLSNYLASVHGRRKAMILFSEGIDYNINDPFNNPGATVVVRDTRDAIASATRANVSVYAVDPRGLSSLAGYDAELTGGPADADPSLNLGPTGMQEEFRLQLDSLRVLSEETGGFAAINSNDFTAAFDRIQKDNSRYYVLGYYPSDERRDGGFRKLDVKVVNRPGVTVRFRKGYVAPRGKVRAAATASIEAKEGTPAAMRELLSSPLPVRGLRLTATAAAFKGPAGKASVNVVLYADGRDMAFTLKDGRYEDGLSLAMVAVEQEGGKTKGGFHEVLNMPLLPATYQDVARTGLRVVSTFDVPPGRYQLRVAASERNAQRAGTLFYDLEVPDFDNEPLTMSGVVLTSTLAQRVRTAVSGSDVLKQGLPGPPTVSREFQSGEELALLAEIYDNETKHPHRVDITASLRSDDGREILRQEDERASSELGGGKGGYGYTTRIPLEGLPPGLYVLKVEARSRLGKNVTASREVQFRVLP